jgi:hypothetical protein
MLAEISLIDGVKGALDSTFTPWDNTSHADRYRLVPVMLFDSPPSVESYASNQISTGFPNGYMANEVYGVSKDVSASGGEAGPKPILVKYKTTAVGQHGIIFIGNVEFDGKHRHDVMMYSMPNKPGLFPKYNFFESPSTDGSPITALASFQDKILQFRANALYVLNVSNIGQIYTEYSFRDCGVSNPCQVFATGFGIIFVNKHGCFIYDGVKVVSLTSGKFDWSIQSNISESFSNHSDATVPCVGYDPRSQSIVVLKNIAYEGGDLNGGSDGWVYNMLTRSWTEADTIIENVAGTPAADRFYTNFIITSEGYLSIKRNTVHGALGDRMLQNFNHVQADAKTIVYQTKDLDFGLPSQTKKLFKVYVTFKGNPANITVTYGKDGAALSGTNLPFGFTASGWSDSTTLSVATFTPDDSAEAKDWKSISLRFDSSTNTVATTFEINDISILYRARPIK